LLSSLTLLKSSKRTGGCRKGSLSSKETLRESNLKTFTTRSGILSSSSKVVPTHNPTTSLPRGSFTLSPVESEEVVVAEVADVVVETEL
jgi:hypothetical protein